MSKERNSRNGYSNLNPCKCCLDKGFFKKLWSEYYYEDKVEVFGEMLIQVFSLPWPPPDENAQETEQICDSCIDRLRDAWNFKQQILTIDEQLETYEMDCEELQMQNKTIEIEINKQFDNENHPLLECKEEIEEIEPEYEDVEYLILAVEESEDVEEEKNDAIYLEDDDQENELLEMEHTTDETTNTLPTIPSSSKSKSSSQSIIKTEQNPEQIEQNADEIEENTEEIEQNTEQAEQSTERKRKWPRKRRRNEKTKFYKQYTEEALRNCIAAVRNCGMAARNAAEYYNVPVKTLRRKLNEDYDKKVAKYTEDYDKEIESLPSDDTKAIRYKLFKEIKIILTYTNAVPFKTKTSRYYCAYCSTDGPFFEEPDDLRTHTRTVHFDERVKVIDQIMRPYFFNEVLKVDIDNFHCTVCCIAILSWNDMFKHLKEKHEIDLDLAYSKVVPFNLQREIRCVLCKEQFPNFNLLDAHMNSHYSNHICSECGDTFLSYHRYMKHTLLHNTGKFPCEECGKVFALENYRKKHVKLVHNQEKLVKCLYCSEKFTTDYPRHLHVVEKHPEKVKLITCEQCGLTFDWHPYYSAHIRRKHKKRRDFSCKYCDKQFTALAGLKKHEMSHGGGTKNYICPVCEKAFAKFWILKQHARIHKEGLAIVSGSKNLTF